VRPVPDDISRASARLQVSPTPSVFSELALLFVCAFEKF
jgi:hypothetical protein